MTQRYHVSTWPLAPTPQPRELLAFLDRDYGLTPTSTDEALYEALRRAGHRVSVEDGRHWERVRDVHSLRRYEALTGHPF